MNRRKKLGFNVEPKDHVRERMMKKFERNRSLIKTYAQLERQQSQEQPHADRDQESPDDMPADPDRQPNRHQA